MRDCYRYSILNNGSQETTGRYTRDSDGSIQRWIAYGGGKIFIDEVRGGTIIPDDPNYFSVWCRATKLQNCAEIPDDGGGGEPVGTIEILEVNTTVDYGDRLSGPSGTAEIIASASGGGIEYSIDGLYWKGTNLFNKLRAGDYFAWARLADTDTKVKQRFTISRPPRPLLVSFSAQKQPTTVGGFDGEIKVEILSGGGNYQIGFNHDNSVHNLSSGSAMQSMVKTGLGARIYGITVTDLVTGAISNGSVTLLDPVVAEPTVVGTFLKVPMMNSIQFVIEDFSQPQALDNRLLVNQKFPKTKKTHYAQPIKKDDFITTEVQTNYQHVKCELFHYETGELAKTFAAPELKEKNIGATSDFNIRIQPHGVVGQSRVYFGEGPPPIPVNTEDSFEILNNNDGFNGIYKAVTIAVDPNLGYEYLVIAKAWNQPAEVAAVFGTGRFKASTANFDVFWFIHTFLEIANGCYCMKITGYDEVSEIVAVSEPLNIQLDFNPNWPVVKYTNVDNAFGISFSHGYIGVIRFPGLFGHRRNPGGERSVNRNADWSLTKINARKKRTFPLHIEMVPPWMHEKLNVLFDCDYWTINGVPCQTEENYDEPRWIDGILLASTTITVEQAKWFDEYNSDDIGSIAEGGFILTNNKGRIKR